MIGFDPDDHLIGGLHPVRDQPVQLRDTVQTVVDAAGHQHRPVTVFQTQVVMVFGPVDPQKHFHRFLLTGPMR